MSIAIAVGLAGSAAGGEMSTAVAPFPNFESGVVHPLVLSPSGAELLALNTPDHRVEFYSTSATAYLGSVFTGLEPVSMTFGDDDQLFVANLLSDTVSVVSTTAMQVTATIAVGDEPRDVVVAGGKLFVACSRTANNENVVVVHSALAPYALLGEVPINAHKPRSLVLSGNTVYVIPQNSGNHTTILSEEETYNLGITQDMTSWTNGTNTVALDPGPLNGNDVIFLPLPGLIPPPLGRIVLDSERDLMIQGLTSTQTTSGPRPLPDEDIFAIDVTSLALSTQRTTGVATTLFAMERNPYTNELWVVGTDAKNRTRFEPSLKGDGVENDVVVVAPGPGGAISARIHLEPPFTPTGHVQPAALAFTDNVDLLPYAYVAALGTASVIVIDPITRQYVQTIATGEIPSGLVVDNLAARLYVLCRGDKTIRSYDITNNHAPLGSPVALSYDPEPTIVSEGRKHLYDGRPNGHGVGNMSCASCHPFGDLDTLAWDLGDAGGTVGYVFPELMQPPEPGTPAPFPANVSGSVHPMKGPMVTQSLRGLLDGAALHWRGDRRFFQMFRGAFRGLLGGSGVTDLEMQEFTSFIESVVHPPNPYEPKDRIYTGSPKSGLDIMGITAAGVPYNNSSNGSCAECHEGNLVTNFQGGGFGVLFDGNQQLFNIPQFRGLYEKDFIELTGFGTNHEGSSDGPRGFLDFEERGIGTTFLEAFPNFTPSMRDDAAAAIRQWDTGISPRVGDQFTLTLSSLGAVDAWLNVAEAETQLTAPAAIDLIGKGWINTGSTILPIGVWFTFDMATSTWHYMTDLQFGVFADRAAIKYFVQQGSAQMTFTCVPPGMGRRLGIDRDEDFVTDGHERALGTLAECADTDGDGYADPLDPNPTVFDTFVADSTAPVVVSHSVAAIFATSATLNVVTNEPATVSVSVLDGSSVVHNFSTTAMRMRHDLVMTGLPPADSLTYTVTVTDKNGNNSSANGSFGTVVMLAHVDTITITKTPTSGQVLVTTSIRIVDQDGQPVIGIPVLAGIADTVAGPNVLFGATGANGVALFTVGTFPTSPTRDITVSPLMAGDVNSTGPFYVGDVGGSGSWSFYYEQSANDQNFEKTSVP